jgi:site-specific recombinase XerD
VRVYFRWLDERGSIHGSPFDDAPVPAHDHAKARVISEDQVNLMLTGAMIEDSKLKSIRDTMLILLLAREGLKVSELTLLKWSHFFATGSSGRLSIPGDRARTIGLEAETTEVILQCRKALSEDHRTKGLLGPDSAMIVAFKGADARAVQFGITRHGLKFAIYELGLLAQLKHLNAEQLRHAAMEHKLMLGFTPDMLMNHLGLRRIGNIGKHLVSHQK